MSTRSHITTSVRRVARLIRRSQRNWSWAVLLGLATLAACVGTAEAIDLRSWDRKINNAHARFEVLQGFNDEAVLDKETQLVWERFTRCIHPTLGHGDFHLLRQGMGGSEGVATPEDCGVSQLGGPDGVAWPYLASRPSLRPR